MNKFYIFLLLLINFGVFVIYGHTYSSYYFEEIFIASDAKLAVPHKARKKLSVTDLSSQDQASGNLKTPTDQKELD